MQSDFRKQPEAARNTHMGRAGSSHRRVKLEIVTLGRRFPSIVGSAH